MSRGGLHRACIGLYEVNNQRGWARIGATTGTPEQ